MKGKVCNMVMNMLTPYWEKPFDLECPKLFSDPCTGAPMIKVPIRHKELWKELERKLQPIYRVTDVWRIPYAKTDAILARCNVIWLELHPVNPVTNSKIEINNKEEVIRWNSMKILSR